MYFDFLFIFVQAYRDESHTVDLAKAEADAKVREMLLCSIIMYYVLGRLPSKEI